VADGASDSSTTRIAEGGDLASEGGGDGEGVGDLLGTTNAVLDTTDDFLVMAISVSVHHAAADDQVVWRLVVVWADDEFAEQMLRIVTLNLLVTNVTVCLIIRMRVNLHVGYFGTNLRQRVSSG
jgi:hypothetical protein